MSIGNRQATKAAPLSIILFLVKAACGGKEAPLTVPAGAQAGDLADLEPCSFEKGGEDYAAECGTLIVPENRSDPNSRLIALPVTRIKAVSAAPAEPIFWFQGGPGQPNVIGYSLDGLSENHDFVMVGYRGMEGQVVVPALRSVKRSVMHLEHC